MIAIACVDKNNGIGKDGKLLISIPEDMKFFREKTANSIVVMGRKTLYSFKDKAPLKNRINIVFTKNTNLKDNYKNYDNIYFVQSKSELYNLLNKFKEKEVYLIGGANLYNELLDECEKAYITRLNTSFDADSFFPNLEDRGFIVDSISETFHFNEISYNFVTYIKH